MYLERQQSERVGVYWAYAVFAHEAVGQARTVVLHPKIVDAVDGNRTVERVVDGVATNVTVPNGADHVEVDAVAADAAHLPGVAHFDVLNPRGERLALRAVANAQVLLVPRVEHDVATVLVELRHRVALDDDVTGEDGDVGAHLDRVATCEVFGLPQMLKQ